MEIRCPECGTEFEDYPSNRRKFCSYQCYWKNLEKRKPWNYQKAGTYHHTLEARRRKSQLMRKLCREGKRNPPHRRPELLTSQESLDIIRSLYIDQKLSARKIGNRLGVSNTLILRRLKMFNIRRFKVSLTPTTKLQTTHWIFQVPCFLCQEQTRCGPYVHSRNPESCEELERWLMNLPDRIKRLMNYP